MTNSGCDEMQDLVMAVAEALEKIDGGVNITATCPARAARSSAKIKKTGRG